MEDPIRSQQRPEGDDASIDEASLEALEQELAPALGMRGGGVPAAPDGLRASLRRSFVSGDFEGDAALEPALADALRTWGPEPAGETCRAAALDALLNGEDAGAAEPSTASRVPTRSRLRHERPRRAPSPARSTSTRLRLLVGGGILAAAAAVLLLVQGGARAEWTLDDSTRLALASPEGLAGIRVDGRPIDSIDDLVNAAETSRTITTGEVPIRLMHGDDFVVELGEETSLDVVTNASEASGTELHASAGSIRIATGPGFDGGRQSLVLTTPHVRTRVTGTVFGVDVYDQLSCVCCLEGQVDTVATTGRQSEELVGEGKTRLVFANGQGSVRELVEGHEPGLKALRERVAATYWTG